MLFQGSGLFAKIVLWFVVTVLVVMVVLSGTAFHLQNRAESDHLTMVREMLSEQARFFVFFLETADFPEPKKFESLQFIPIWFFDEAGKLLFASRKAGGQSNHDGGVESPKEPAKEPALDPSPLVSQMAVATESFRQFQLNEGKFLGHRLTGKAGNMYFAFVRMKDRGALRFPRAIMETSAGQWILMGTLIIGLLCFWLAKYLVSPIIQMQQLSRRLTGGDLQARLPVGLTERYDELGALATDFNVMAERIEQTIQGQRQLLRDISHELRTPLTRIGLAVELARKAEPDKRGALITKVEENLERLDALIQQILELARLGQMKEVPAQPTEIDLVPLATALLADAGFEAEAQGRTVNAVIVEGPILLRGFAELLRRILENVIRNPLQHTPKESEIAIRLSRRAEGERNVAIIEVRDHGPGVPDDQLPHIFEPFYRGAGNPAGTNNGVGLGLAIAQRAVQAHGGTIVARNADGGGLLVEIRLPMVSPA